jgi:Fe-S-cluster containining protein
MTDEANAAQNGELAALCRSCGLCCDGSLFGRVDLEPEEVELAKTHRLRILPHERSFEQPCTALARSGPERACRCSIYDERPVSCRRFTCLLYERHRREGGAIEARLEVVRRVRQLVDYLEASGWTPADFEGAPSSPQSGDHDRAGDHEHESALRAYVELTRSLEEDFARAP